MKRLIYLIILISSFLTECKSKNINILVIGDSHGAKENGWVDQLKLLRSDDTIINYSISGNTIGFNNLKRDTLNTLKNINSYLTNACNLVPKLDKILILLGTNDCKAIFDSLQYNVIQNYDSLIFLVTNYDYPNNLIPQIYIISPPPASPDSLLIKKYIGITKRLETLVPKIKKVAEINKLHYIDIYTPMKNNFDTLNSDGIHLNEKGYKYAAQLINQNL